MATINIGEGFDQTKARVDVKTDGGAGLTVDVGNRHQQAELDLNVSHDERGRHRAPAPSVASTPRTVAASEATASGSRIWAVGSFLLVAISVVACVAVLIARSVSMLALPVVLGAALLLFYLIALFLVPPTNAKGVARFQAVLAEYVKLLVGSRSKPKQHSS
jgi:Flp pilus assembly protein TadB